MDGIGPVTLCLTLARGLASPVADQDAPRRPQDPNSAPMTRAPGGQPATDMHRWEPQSPRSPRRGFRFTLMPQYSSLRVGFIGRPSEPIRGGGAALALDLPLWKPVGLRVAASYAAHALIATYTSETDTAPTLTAPGGVLHAIDVGAGPRFAIDLGAVIPMVELGLGVLLLRGPEGVQDGQAGQPCRASACDLGLRCGADDRCHLGAVPRIHAGAGIDLPLGRRWLVGAAVRYFALLTAPTVFPVFIQAGLRVGVGW